VIDESECLQGKVSCLAEVVAIELRSRRLDKCLVFNKRSAGGAAGKHYFKSE
jgi:hypothetical protein